MQSAIYTNNRAASLIENDCFERALELLNQALSTVQNQAEKADPSTRVIRQTTPVQLLSTSNKKRKDLEGSMYAQPIYVDQTPQIQGHRFLSLVILFNLALCHHLMALHGSEDREENLVSALQLYESAITMHNESSLPKDVSFFMTMYNLAHIYQMLHRPRQAQQFLNKMLNTLLAMMDNGEDESMDQFDNFLDNASRIVPTIGTAMAA